MKEWRKARSRALYTGYRNVCKNFLSLKRRSVLPMAVKTLLTSGRYKKQTTLCFLTAQLRGCSGV